MSDHGTLNYCIRIVLPSGRFFGELDPDRLVVRTTARRVTEYIDLAWLLAEYRAGHLGGTVTPR